MILVVWHPVFGAIKLCDVETVEEGFEEVNRYIKINKLETITASTGSGANSSGVTVTLGRYEYPLDGYCLSRQCNKNHIYEIGFTICYEYPKEHPDGKKIYIRNLGDVTNIELPQLISNESELIQLEKDEIRVGHTYTYLHSKYMFWTYPDGYSHIKKYLEDLEARKKGN